MSTTKLTVAPREALLNERVSSPLTASDWVRPRADAQDKIEAVTNGAAVAALVAAGIGCAVFGLFVILNEASPAFHNLMTLNNAVGPLSGKSTFPVLIWLLTWGLLHAGLRQREVNFRVAGTITAVLILISLLSTFPPFFLLFAAE